MIYAFEDFVPVVHETAFVHPQAAVTGNVIIGRDVYVGPGAAIRGDWGGIEIGDGCNVQENCTIHMFPGATVVLEPRRAHRARRGRARRADRRERADRDERRGDGQRAWSAGAASSAR
jgi:serine acetyltransferase